MDRRCLGCRWTGQPETEEYPPGSNITWDFCPECGLPESSLVDVEEDE